MTATPSNCTTATAVSWATNSPALAYGTQASQTGLILSPASEPFPQKLVDKARSGQFMEMKEFLADNMALMQQLESVPGMPPISMLGSMRPRLRDITSLPTWCYCFLGYMAIRTSDPVTRDQLTYARLLIREARRHGGTGWLAYDRAFRQQAAADPTQRWNTLIPGLQASTILGQRTAGQGLFCTLCREVDHSRAQCALACLEPPTTTSGAQPTRSSRPYNTRRRLDNICISWNKGNCIFPGQCSYRHVCATCQLPHKARDCVKTPITSVYKLDTHRPQTTTTTTRQQ